MPFLARDIETFKATYPLLENKRLFNVYPDLVCNVLEDMFSVKPTPGVKALQSLRSNMKGKVSFLDLVKDLFQIGKGIAL